MSRPSLLLSICLGFLTSLMPAGIAFAGYESVRRMFIDPIEQANALSLRIGSAIAHHFGAHG